MEMRGQDKELEMPTTLGYNSSSSKLSASTTTGVEKSDQPSQTYSTTTLIFNDPPPQTHQNHRHHHPHPLYPPPHLLIPSNNQLHQSQRTSTDPDLTSNHPSPIATTSTISTPIASNTPRTPPITIATTAAATTTQTPATTTINITSTTASSNSLIRYRECLRNHAASMGSHVVDGCGEFMPGGEEGTPKSLKCAACDCHRNFHRKEVEGSSLQRQQHQQHHDSSNYQSYYPNKHNGQNNLPSPHLQFYTPPSSSLYQQQHHRFSHGVAAATTPSGGLVQPVMMAFRGVAESSSEDLNVFQSNTVGGQLSVQAAISKKRFRTKFTQNQKDRMMELAEKLGWKIQKHDEQEVQQFCTQVGVKRQIFKVWMHNNKQVMKKKQHM